MLSVHFTVGATELILVGVCAACTRSLGVVSKGLTMAGVRGLTATRPTSLVASRRCARGSSRRWGGGCGGG